MSVSVAAWLFFRWLLWIAAAAYCIEFYVRRTDYLKPSGHILPATEFWMFALPTAAVFAGFFELMMRERTGLPRPAMGRNWNFPDRQSIQEECIARPETVAIA
jgi:hypothetical protein